VRLPIPPRPRGLSGAERPSSSSENTSYSPWELHSPELHSPELLGGERPTCYTTGMTAYLIVNYSVADPDLYKTYQKGAGPALKIGSECKVLVLDPKSEVVEGEGAGHQTVVLEFESKERAKELYESGEYQEVLPHRLNATTNHFAVLVDGFVMPS
jgi:uncharacterized protein (DUF1330 family)